MDSSEIPEGFRLAHNVVSREVWDTINSWLQTGRFPSECTSDEEGVLSPIPWEVATENRRVAQFGFRYDYQGSVVDTDSNSPPIPPMLKRLLLDPVVSSLDIQFTQCIINDYHDATVDIPWHVDHEDFGPVVLVYTFGDDRPLNFRCFDKEKFVYFSAHPRHGSRYILSGPSRDT